MSTLSWADNRAVQIEKSPLVRSYMRDRLKCYNMSFPCSAWIGGLRMLCCPFGQDGTGVGTPRGEILHLRE
jgi:hypothetical protein